MRFCRRKSFSKRNRRFPSCVARPSFLLPGSEETQNMLLLLQHHLLQRYKDPCSNSPRLEAAAEYISGGRQRRNFPLLPRGSFGNLVWSFSSLLSSRAQASHEKIPAEQLQASVCLPCTKLCRPRMSAQQLQRDPACLPAGDRGWSSLPWPGRAARLRFPSAAEGWNLGCEQLCEVRPQLPFPHLPLVRDVQVRRRDGKLAIYSFIYLSSGVFFS